MKQVLLPWQNASIAVKLIIFVVTTVILTALVITVINVQLVTDQLEQDLNDQGDVVLSSLTQSSREPLLQLRVNELNSIAQASSDSDNVLGVHFYNSDGQELVDTTDSAFQLTFEADALAENILDNPTAIYRERTEDTLIVGQVVQVSNEVLGVAVVEMSTATLQENSANIQRTSIIATFVVVLLAILSTFLITRQFTAPLRSLTEGAKEFGNQNFDVAIPVKGNDEFAVLGSTFNQMAHDLKAMIDNLEKRVNERTLDIATAAIISRQITTSLDIDVILQEVVEQTVKSFNYNASFVFLFDKDRQLLARSAGFDKDNRIIALENTELPLNTPDNLLTYVASNRIATRNYEFSQDGQTHNSKLATLLASKSELAIPMTVGDKLIGILDIHSAEAERFGTSDELVLTIIAEQIAIAVRNAQLFAETKAAQAEAEKADNVKSQFLASVSHELRTPLNGILNFTAFVADEMLGPVNEEQVNVLRDVITNGEHLLALINDVLDISKIEAGSLKLFLEDDVEIATEIETVAKTGVALIDDKPVKLVLEVAENLPQLRGDRRRIRQIVLNLVSNACKFTDEGQVLVTASQVNNEMLIGVKDTGPGIAAEDVERVFETFIQTETGLQQGAGTGLGLPISRRLAEAHGGRLWVESTVGEGAQFFVALPLEYDFNSK